MTPSRPGAGVTCERRAARSRQQTEVPVVAELEHRVVHGRVERTSRGAPRLEQRATRSAVSAETMVGSPVRLVQTADLAVEPEPGPPCFEIVDAGARRLEQACVTDHDDVHVAAHRAEAALSSHGSTCWRGVARREARARRRLLVVARYVRPSSERVVVVDETFAVVAVDPRAVGGQQPARQRDRRPAAPPRCVHAESDGLDGGGGARGGAGPAERCRSGGRRSSDRSWPECPRATWEQAEGTSRTGQGHGDRQAGRDVVERRVCAATARAERGQLHDEGRAASRGASFTVPPCAATTAATIERPRPAPPRSRDRDRSAR